MSSKPYSILALGAVVAALSFPALAQGPGPGGPGGGPGFGRGGGGGSQMGVLTALCAKEIDAYCTATPRGPAAWVCLKGHEKDLSENCVAAVEGTGPDMGPGMGPVARLCMTEIADNCAGIEHGTGLVRQCLDNSRSKLSEGCRMALDNTGWGRRRAGPQ
ncbi:MULTISPECIES: hypothetical protein [Rhodopseudomonas]|uniref:Cysteine rich repeat domain protein n=1 Tax=Rhodopseudomonas palustris TaxID=1076 RepID=A0A0D7EFV3_RHOPL|nr:MULTISPECIES: hypothetical protein [Rhodopseudomonas]KIZ39395.1 hypothetical protein OO17_20560 [Rhodopseudomonas palustris]MDF3809585.1 hypothetical protein [Rhodopseudomonas sp. BAL398]WOK17781.1 hypothetical protein RBJ75_27315 [Rhodopseudomonas sp. BAL398]